MIENTKYDLHCHSYYSDGELSPEAVINKAAQANITHLALTDHDTVEGLNEARLAASKVGVNLINGVELSCTWENRLIHVVGLNIDPSNPALRDAIAENKRRRLDRAEAMFEDFEQNGIELRESVQTLLVDRSVPTRPHFADALISQGYAKNKKQAFKRFLVKGKPGYIPMHWLGLSEVGHAITASGGVAVLAHPMRYKLTRTKLCQLIADMVSAQIRGIEVCTASTDRQQIQMLADLAIKFNLYASLGSDFHSEQQPWAKLGQVTPLPKALVPVWEAF